MAQKNVAPVTRTMEQVVAGVKKDLLWLFLSVGLAVGAAAIVNMVLVI
jgi:hypothetical protein